MANIRNKEYFKESWWDWTPFNKCFYPTKIRIADIDGLVERNGYFLVIETKMPGIPVPKGQRILFDALIQHVNWCVMVVWGETNTPEQCYFWREQEQYQITTFTLQKTIRDWFVQADNYILPELHIIEDW